MDPAQSIQRAPGPPVQWQGLLGYLNFSEGKPDLRAMGQMHAACRLLTDEGGSDRLAERLAARLEQELEALRHSGSAAFAEVGHARRAIAIGLRVVPAAFRAHHRDLLAQVPDTVFANAFFLSRCCEAALEHLPADDEPPAEELVADMVRALNDFVGYRPIPVLENRRAGEVYAHERVAPVPLYRRGVGVAAGPYQAIVLSGLRTLSTTDAGLLEEAQLDLSQLDELVLDPRVYDHNHPANKRPNHVFGEWDPHQLDRQGRYRRFVVRHNTLAALHDRVLEAADADRDAAIFDAGAVLAGTLVMATALTGNRPHAHLSGTNLSTLVPRIAQLRDRFYEDLLRREQGPRAERLRREARDFRQPFGATRQRLNQQLARDRAHQLQEHHLAHLFAALGYPRASRDRAERIATPSIRISASIRSLLTTAQIGLERGETAEAIRLLRDAEDLMHRGIECGALADPWCMLGFQGLYPLFQAREDSIHDPRNEELLELVAEYLGVSASTIAEAAGRGERGPRERQSQRMHEFADWWDRFATYEIEDLPRVHAGESAEAADHVAQALVQWQARAAEAGTSAGLAFWRGQLEGFRTPAAFARVVAALLERHDLKAAQGLLIAWLSQASEVPLEEGEHSFHALTRRCVAALCAREPREEHRAALAWFLEQLAHNAEEFGSVPELTAPDENPESARELFEAAYEGVTFEDSADDGTEGSVLGEEPSAAAPFALESGNDHLHERIRFLSLHAEIIRLATPCLAPDPEAIPSLEAVFRARRAALNTLLEQFHKLRVPEPIGGMEAIFEFDRRRALKEHLMEETLHCAVLTEQALRTLQAHGGIPSDDPASWAGLARKLEQHLEIGRTNEARDVLRDLLPLLRLEPLLYVPLQAGGHPARILRARSVQTLLLDLMQQLPRLGLLHETFQLIQTARAMEQASPPEGRKVTEFDRLFPVALQSCVHAVLDLADSPESELRDASLQHVLKQVTDPFLMLWIEHSQSLRLSILESMQPQAEWEQIRAFIQRHGHELLTARNLNLAQIRSILHRGVNAWLDEMPDWDTPPEKFLAALEGKLSRAQAARLLDLILHAIGENYEEYRDYNTTTTQSDYGENLHILLEFLLLKTAYERDNWRMRPLIQVHEVLCRRGLLREAELWHQGILHYTRPHAVRHLEELDQVESRLGVKLRTLRDRLNERFVAPLEIDQLCALLGPAREAARRGAGEDNPDFTLLRDRINAFAAQPTGVGLDVPAWIRRLEDELDHLRHDPQPAPRERSRITAEHLFEQIRAHWSDSGEDPSSS